MAGLVFNDELHVNPDDHVEAPDALDSEHAGSPAEVRSLAIVSIGADRAGRQAGR